MATAPTPVQKIADHLNQAGHPVTEEEVIPTTAETPFKKTEALVKAGATIVGEDLGSDLKDLGYMAEADLKHGDPTRTTDSKNPLKMLIGKLRRKKADNEQIIEK